MDDEQIAAELRKAADKFNEVLEVAKKAGLKVYTQLPHQDAVSDRNFHLTVSRICRETTRDL